MRNADRFTGHPRRAMWRFTGGEQDLPAGVEPPYELHPGPVLPVPEEPDDPDLLQAHARGPARGIIVAVVPALLIWATLMAMVTRLLE